MDASTLLFFREERQRANTASPVEREEGKGGESRRGRERERREKRKRKGSREGRRKITMQWG